MGKSFHLSCNLPDACGFGETGGDVLGSLVHEESAKKHSFAQDVLHIQEYMHNQ